jgi:serine/threonine-protein kinase RIO1
MAATSASNEPSGSQENNSNATCCYAEGLQRRAPTAAELKPAPAKRKPAWSVPSPSDESKSDGGTCGATQRSLTISFADIIAEQSQDRMAALAAYGDDDVGIGDSGGKRSLAEIESEQERLFSTLQLRQRSSELPQPAAVAAARTETPSLYPLAAAFANDEMDAEELRLIQIAMQQSLEEHTRSSHSSTSGSSHCSRNNGDEHSKAECSQGPQPNTVVKEMQDVSADANDPTPPNLTARSSDSKVPSGATSRSSNVRFSDSRSSTPAVPRSESDKSFSERTFRVIERTEVVVDSPHTDALVTEKIRRSSSSSSYSRTTGSPHGGPPSLSIPSSHRRTSASSVDSASSFSFTSPSARPPPLLEDDEEHLSQAELIDIERRLRLSETNDRGHCKPENGTNKVNANSCLSRGPAPAPPSLQWVPPSNETVGSAKAPAVAEAAASFQGLSEEEAAAVEAALREADARAEAESLMLALQIQEEELRHLQERQEQHRRLQQTSGNVRIMTRAELQAESMLPHGHPAASNGLSTKSTGGSWIGAIATIDQPRRHPLDSGNGAGNGNGAGRRFCSVDENDNYQYHYGDEGEAGFRMNSAASQQQWNRIDRNTIVGPDDEVRTKHDVRVQGQTNAQILDLDIDDSGVRAHVGYQAFNSFKKTMKRTTKGVATHGTGRAGSDTSATRGKALDPNVRLQISRAINSGLIERCNGAVKQGKEAIVYYANGGGSESQGFDVAVKVFKRIESFRGRGEYVDGDPRFVGRAFRSMTDREQLELWTEKEYRNLVRAHRAKVPVPTPLHYRENVIFMRFMGTNGWPAPQIREIDMRKGSKKWDALYTQVMESIRRLYVDARLVHGDLSEYNILICPVFQVDHPIRSTVDPSNDLQTVLIDFGQAVDVKHPGSRDLLERDLSRVNGFFMKQGVQTLSVDEAVEFVVDNLHDAGPEEEEELPTSLGGSSPGGAVNDSDAVVRPA